MMKVICILLCVTMLLYANIVFASQIVLKSGQKIVGEVIKQSDQEVSIDTGIGVPVTYYSDEIDTIDGQKIGIKPVEVVNEANIFSMGEEKFTIVDTLARFSEDRQKNPELQVFFFAHPLSEAQKQEFKNNPFPTMYDYYTVNFSPVLVLTVSLNSAIDGCIESNVRKNFLFSPVGNKMNLSNSGLGGINRLSCQLADGEKVQVKIKGVSKHPSTKIISAWDIESEVDLVVAKGKSGPIKESLSPSVFTPNTDLFKIQGVLLLYYQSHGKWPQNSDIEQLNNVSNKMVDNDKVDVSQYDFDFQETADGGLKVKYKLNSSSSWATISLGKPSK